MNSRSPNKTLREFGALIVKKRTTSGRSSREMADLIGISQSCLSRIENGSREVRLGMLRKLNAVLGLEREFLRYLKTGKF